MCWLHHFCKMMPSGLVVRLSHCRECVFFHAVVVFLNIFFTGYTSSEAELLPQGCHAVCLACQPSSSISLCSQSEITGNYATDAPDKLSFFFFFP